MSQGYIAGKGKDEMSGNKNNGSKKVIKIVAFAAAIVVAFGMGILAYHEFQRNIVRPVKLAVQGKDALAVDYGEATGEEKESGRVAGEEKEVPISVTPVPSSVPSGTEAETAFIGEEAAKEAALAHAGVQESDTSYLNCHVDYDDGRAKCYDVDFAAGGVEYEYEVDLYTGDIRKSSVESKNQEHGKERTGRTENDRPDNTSAGYIGEEAAFKTAVAHAGTEESAITHKKIEIDEENGKMVYEIEFEVGRKEYDYEIDAVSGEILKAEEEWD